MSIDVMDHDAEEQYLMQFEASWSKVLDGFGIMEESIQKLKHDPTRAKEATQKLRAAKGLIQDYALNVLESGPRKRKRSIDEAITEFDFFYKDGKAEVVDVERGFKKFLIEDEPKDPELRLVPGCEDIREALVNTQGEERIKFCLRRRAIWLEKVHKEKAKEHQLKGWMHRETAEAQRMRLANDEGKELEHHETAEEYRERGKNHRNAAAEGALEARQYDFGLMRGHILWETTEESKDLYRRIRGVWDCWDEDYDVWA